MNRDADVPIGVQIAWAIRARIGDGTLKQGQRLPGLRELAEGSGVNINTVRAVYQRLEHDGLIDRQQGSGTFVTSTARGSAAVGEIAASAAREAHESGIDPRDVAAALYVASDSAAQADAGAERRRVLRMQIAALELAASEIEVEHPNAAREATVTHPSSGPRLLGTDDLERVRAQLVRRLATLQHAIEEQPTDDPQTPPRAKERETADTGATPLLSTPAARRRAATRPAPAS